MEARRQLAVLWGGVALACAAGLAFLPRLLPETLAAASAGLPACPVRSIAGLPCPTCGATRATLALAGLDLAAALAWNPLVTLAWLGSILGGITALALALLRRPLPSLPRRLSPAARWTVLLVVAANWFYLLRQGI